MSTGCQSKLPNGNVGVSERCMRFTRGTTISSFLPQPSLVLIVSTGLLVLLFLSAAFLLYRIGRIHSQFAESSIHAGRSVMYVYCFSNNWYLKLHKNHSCHQKIFLKRSMENMDIFYFCTVCRALNNSTSTPVPAFKSINCIATILVCYVQWISGIHNFSSVRNIADSSTKILWHWF
jgi:hypothetical protein